jgi:hypothetical protein
MQKLNQEETLPINEIIDRLYHRQEPEVIVNDLIRRNKIQQADYNKSLLVVNNIKLKIESLRINP